MSRRVSLSPSGGEGQGEGAMPRCDSILLIAFGGPEKPEDIRPFLKNVAEGRAIPPERLEEVAQHYEAIGGRSPINDLTRLQAEGLRRVLRRENRFERVYIGMRNWHPFLHESLAEMKRNGHLRALGIILSSFQTEASWDRYLADVARDRARVGTGCPDDDRRSARPRALDPRLPEPERLASRALARSRHRRRAARARTGRRRG